ncbi:centromere protein M [Exaiptasia diaphana]|uniref:Centromere protein M n=1 Tax=Exaiptasia diaphana TaxID=2652724 RepID=A0A913XBE7_EXADI|nr:centromere protein M [Exaiptasia diaphana]KXJ26651.1 Centromere protein M [Exaiptasia diaphana]
MAGNEVLSRFNKLPTRNQATALFVGVKGSGKHKIANALLKEYAADFRVQIRIATSLPLPPDTDDSRPRIDFIVFFMDACNKTSYDLVKSALHHVDIEFFLGHCCFVATSVRSESNIAISTQDITRLANSYDSPLLCGEIQTERGQKILAKKLIRYLGIAAGFNPGITPMLLDTTKPSLVNEEEESNLT